MNSRLCEDWVHGDREHIEALPCMHIWRAGFRLTLKYEDWVGNPTVPKPSNNSNNPGNSENPKSLITLLTHQTMCQDTE
jgi:hypothetical protein